MTQDDLARPDEEELFFPDEETVREELEATYDGFSVVCRPTQSTESEDVG